MASLAKATPYGVDLEEEYDQFNSLSTPEFTDGRWDSVVEYLLILQGPRTHREQPQVLVTQLVADRWWVHQPPEPVADPLPWAMCCIPHLHVLRAFDRKEVEHLATGVAGKWGPVCKGEWALYLSQVGCIPISLGGGGGKLTHTCR